MIIERSLSPLSEDTRVPGSRLFLYMCMCLEEQCYIWIPCSSLGERPRQMGQSPGAFYSCSTCLYCLWHCPTCCRSLPLSQVMSLIIWRSKPSSYFDLKPGKRAKPWVALFLAICVAWTDGLLCIKPAVTVWRGICSVLRHSSWWYLDLAVKVARSV